ncbi:DNA polymerase III subunit gamma/tau [Neobacillus notoginsengisoli]|uniref:DNA-directed DNA polymerase n=1 Tax=Neobacillus notoginsengisoli TaxID=1578198 RepID=A0A417YE70_9BACI|nr:DNA polymerase III subunit gamma/tau [Neobacillus notoginsengisoli]RHW30924.1 DNA polymerase III subunit gamma/tau [Neobacillus notoginsengisoli]
MAYQALYRVWRPQAFYDVVGQEHITQTLQNALVQQKTTHAYLFSGPRGTGKTTAAKILAKAVNCERAPVSEPCNECSACRGITDGSIQDVIEIDAASNNGVDEIRDIRDKVKYAPSSVKYKVYIIDEVHMLSTGAFNALLKTLEEPPRHVMFILATTEPHKIPLTIVSRCQRFDFKRITSQAIVGRMKLIADETSAAYDPAALPIIARAAEGGMRDALSLLDQAISFSHERVTVEDALTVTGSVSQGFLYDMGEAVHEKDVAKGLDALNELLFHGKDPSRFIEDFILFFRDMLLYKTAPSLEESLERVSVDEGFRDLANQFSIAQIYDLIEMLNKTQQEMRWTTHPRIFLEVAIVKLCQLENSTSSGEAADSAQVSLLLNRIEKLEAELKELRKQGIPSVGEPAGNQPKPAQRVARRGFQAPAGRINEVLKNATKADLTLLKTNWGEMLRKLMKSHAALLNEAEPVASSSDALVIKFKHEIHCQMAMDNPKFTEAISEGFRELTGRTFTILGVPEDQWLTIRENFLSNHQVEGGEEAEAKKDEDVLVDEAKKLFGGELIQVID